MRSDLLPVLRQSILAAKPRVPKPLAASLKLEHGWLLPYLLAARKHDQLPVTGGSIGQGLPVALGAALACPDRKVVALEADGSGMYTPQTLWTIARENLDVVTVILANRRYRILDIEMRRTGANGDKSRAPQFNRSSAKGHPARPLGQRVQL